MAQWDTILLDNGEKVVQLLDEVNGVSRQQEAYVVVARPPVPPFSSQRQEAHATPRAPYTQPRLFRALPGWSTS